MVVMTKNEKIYKIFRPLGYDYFFYNVIIFLFYTVTKELSVSEVLYINSFYAACIFLLEIPLGYVVEKIGIRKSIILGGFCWILHCVIVIFSQNYLTIFLAQIPCAFGTGIKGLSETQMLYASLKASNRTREFSRVEGASVAKYYYLEAFFTIIVGYLFTVDEYLPIVLTLILLVIAFLVSLNFEEVENKNKVTKLKDYVQDSKIVLSSKRMRAIFFFCFVMSGVIGCMTTLQESLIVDLGVNPMVYSIIFAILTFCVGIGSKVQHLIEKYTKRKNLSVIGIAYAMTIILAGAFNYFNVIDKNVLLVITVVFLFFQNTLQGTYRISAKKYLNHFTTSKVRGKILAFFYIFENIGKTVFLFVAGYVMDFNKTSTATIIMGMITLTLVIFSILFMKGRLGLDPEEYEPKDILYKDLSS